MKICVLGDPHFKKNNLDIMHNACNEILSIIDKCKPDLTICLGDTLDTHERIYLRAQTQAINFFIDIAKRCHLIVIIGNHDRENNSDFQSNIHPFTGLNDHPNITIVDKCIWDKQNNFIYVPYVPPGRFREALMTAGYDPHLSSLSLESAKSDNNGNEINNDNNSNEIDNDSNQITDDNNNSNEINNDKDSNEINNDKNSNQIIDSKDSNEINNDKDSNQIADYKDSDEIRRIPKLIFCHQEFSGCRMGAIVSSKGDVWAKYLPLIISGHIHEYQVLPKIIYVGTFIQQNYGEGSDKAILIITLLENENRSENRSDNTDVDMKIERIHLVSAPKRVTVHMNIEDLENFADKLPPDMIPKTANEKYTETQGSLVRVILHIDATDTRSLRYNVHYRSLENMVDKIDLRTESNRTSVAENMVLQLQQTGSLDINKQMYSLEEIVRAMLKNDTVASEIFEKEILQTSSESMNSDSPISSL